MTKDKKIFEKTINNNDLKLHFIFIGTEIEKNIDYKELQKLIDNIFDKNFFNDDLTKIVNYIRTIFKEFDEKSLQVDICTNKDKMFVLLKNKELKRYRSIKNYEKKNSVIINYYGNEFKFLCPNADTRTNDILQKELQLINNLNKIEAKTFLTPEEKMLSYCYYQFYNEYPDFSDKKINRRIQIMMYLLNELSYCGFMKKYNCGYLFREKDIFPSEYYYINLINDLAPLGEINTIDSIKIPSYMKKIIDIVKEEINNYLDNVQDKEKALEQICLVDYVNKFCFYNKANEKQIAQHINIDCEEENISKVLKKVKEIRTKLNEE